jgi:hypothetical protein
MTKICTWIVLFLLLFISVFRIYGADLNSNVLAVALMLLLLALFSDLKEFNFWGLWGKKKEMDLKKLEGEKAISTGNRDVSKKEIVEAEKQTQLQLMDIDKGNFLAFAFEIERLLRIFAGANLAKDIPSNVNVVKLSKELKDKELLTESGLKQLDAIRWLRNMLVHGRDQEINYETLKTGIQIASTFYQEIYTWLYPPPQTKQ